MIEELKGLLDVVAATPGYALWGLAMFIGWKMIIYLSTTGAVVFVARLLIQAIQEMHAKKYEAPPEVTHSYKLDGYTIGSGTRLLAAIEAWADGGYIHGRQQNAMIEALADAKDKFDKERQERLKV